MSPTFVLSPSPIPGGYVYDSISLHKTGWEMPSCTLGWTGMGQGTCGKKRVRPCSRFASLRIRMTVGSADGARDDGTRRHPARDSSAQACKTRTATAPSPVAASYCSPACEALKGGVWPGFVCKSLPDFVWLHTKVKSVPYLGVGRSGSPRDKTGERDSLAPDYRMCALSSGSGPGGNRRGLR